jgi:dolichol-phosphate mannosyltransferase
VIYFCIPAYNEERTVGVVLWKLRQVMAEHGRDYQIIVVDDASTDSTPAVLSPYIRVLPLTVFRNTERRGYTDSLELAVREALRRSPYPKRDAVITLQADFTEDPDVVPALVKRIEAGADVVATNIALEAGTPRSVRWARRVFHWLLRRRKWAAVGDPLSGFRAYRVVVLKRALEARAGGRLLTWSGYGANVELLAQTVPHSRRTDVVDTTLKQHRLQRPTRFSFMTAWRDVFGASRGKPFASVGALPSDSVIATPLPIVVEPPAAARGRERDGRGRRPRIERTSERQPRREKQERKPRPTPIAKMAPTPVAPAAPAAADAAVASPDQTGKRIRKRKRPRRRKEKRPQDKLALVVENASESETAPPEVAAPNATEPAEGAPKKKSRRGRRGGRGRRRGPRIDGNNAETQGGNGGEAPPPLAAEGD